MRTDEAAPAPVVVADGSPERRALYEEQVYDEAARWIERLFYRSDFGGVDWAALARSDG